MIKKILLSSLFTCWMIAASHSTPSESDAPTRKLRGSCVFIYLGPPSPLPCSLLQKYENQNYWYLSFESDEFEVTFGPMPVVSKPDTTGLVSYTLSHVRVRRKGESQIEHDAPGRCDIYPINKPVRVVACSAFAKERDFHGQAMAAEDPRPAGDRSR